jgi:type I restriction enzyme R subunit
VREAGFSQADTERARATVESFKQFIAEHRDEITALQIIYGQPYARRALTFQQVKELAEHLGQPPHTWNTESLWLAYSQLEKDKVQGVGARRVLTDVVSLVRHAVQLDDELIPYPERVRARYADWLAAQEASGHTFTAEQRWWLDKVAEHIGVNVCIAPDDFDYGEFFDKGGRIAAARLFGKTLPALLDELNSALTV